MAKKQIENKKLEQEELKPIVIGIQEDRKKSSISIFIVLTLFVLVVIFLPQIRNFLDDLINPDPVATPGTPIKVPSKDDSPDVPIETDPKDDFYKYSEDLVIKDDDIEISNIKFSDNSISYIVKNKTDLYKSAEDLNYYLEIYDSNRTLKERVKLINDGIGANMVKEFNNNVYKETSTDVGFFMLQKMTYNDYPEVSLVEDSNKESSMSCKRDNETVTYKFVDKKLKEVTSLFSYSSTNLDFEQKREEYQNISFSYNRTGITSSFNANSEGITVTSIARMEEAARTRIFNADTFSLDTEAKVVSFEMNSQNFKCE